ncbi:MAG: hypothetical protein HND58_10335 [Planctomycetota bacterium]|nr:MAG: hypothetical protein HND58_10335 [Planctomycetota bacterium]
MNSNRSGTQYLRGVLPVTALVLLSGVATAGELKPVEVGNQLAGEWSGQIRMRSDGEQLSASTVSMSAVRNASASTLELYYEGFAFGKAVDGAMILSFDKDLPGLSLREHASDQFATYRPDPEVPSSGDDALVLSTVSSEGSEVRAVFTRADSDRWSIELQRQAEDGAWVPSLVLQLDRLDHGQRSAAAERFDRAPALMDLRRDRAIASVPTD